MLAEESREAMWERMATERKAKEGKQEPVIQSIVEGRDFQLWNPNVAEEAMTELRSDKYSKSDLYVYFVLSFNMDMKSGKTRNFSRANISEMTGYSDKQTRRVLAKLVDNGLVVPSTDDWKTPKVPVSYYLPHSHKSYQNRTAQSKKETG